VVLDLRGVTFLDSTGVRLALELLESSRAAEWEFAVIDGPTRVQRIFELTGVRSVIPFIAPKQIRYSPWSPS
jgi:anti-anti-sigma factor